MGLKIYTGGTFDLFHAGHVAMLREAKTRCDYLIVGLQTDPTIDRPEKNRPIQTVFERYVQLQACKYIDEVIPYATEKDVEDILQTYQIDVRVIGEDYAGKEFTGKKICVDRNIEIYYNSRKHSFSTSELRQRVHERTLDRKV